MASKIVQRTWTELLGDQDWTRLVRDYQERPCAETSGAFLMALEPAAREICDTLHRLEGRADPEDIWQQYQLAALEIALSLPDKLDPEWIPIRILQGARRSVSRWQRSQLRQSGEPISRQQPSLERVEAAVLDAIDPLMEHPIYRKVVLGESYELQAKRQGVKVEALRKRVSRDIRHLQALRAAGERDGVVDELRRLRYS